MLWYETISLIIISASALFAWRAWRCSKMLPITKEQAILEHLKRMESGWRTKNMMANIIGVDIERSKRPWDKLLYQIGIKDKGRTIIRVRLEEPDSRVYIDQVYEPPIELRERRPVSREKLEKLIGGIKEEGVKLELRDKEILFSIDSAEVEECYKKAEKVIDRLIKRSG